ncbi:glycosyltransferase [Cellulosilyticum ruminicola]|uniref:glycosyltransferase n=1 Tax=Cellulosilyticum ruminicola TaxID=425254 RepID=UPI0006CFADD2|nr:glycosyltransferase [Cellulosilyticum ruminicola]
MKKTILFMVTNGAGLGHLTRGLAIAKRLRALDKEYEIVFLTTSVAIEVLRESGFMFYYVPTKNLMPNGLNGGAWNEFLKRQLKDIINMHKPAAIVFDGAIPYAGLLANINKVRNYKTIWIKRECYKQNVDSLADKEKFFDLTIVPREINEINVSRGPGKVYTNPIMLLDQQEALDRETVREELGIKMDEKLFYVQLGAGLINDIETTLQMIVDKIVENPKYHVLLGEYIIGKSIDIRHPRVKVIRSFPNAKYFKGLDGAISAAGYNTVHELVFFGVPTIFVPNTQTGRDDQVARVQKVEDARAGTVLIDVTPESIKEKLDYIVSNQRILQINAKTLIRVNGASIAARYIKNLI